MARILITSPLPRDGKTTVAAGLAQALRATGPTVRLVRTPGGPTEADDAATFGHLPGIRANGIVETLPDSDTDHIIAEIPDPAHCAALRDTDTPSETKTLLVTRYREADDATLQRAAQAAAPTGLIVNGVPTGTPPPGARPHAGINTPPPARDRTPA